MTTDSSLFRVKFTSSHNLKQLVFSLRDRHLVNSSGS